ncbi:hypothetical protein [Pollutimonas bauzanensis]|uniref:hypothetical protein n=1 Tax=Pollutimonas bauzanensis TaxID=658167 RepID=UPI001FE335F4|nr:hypothetical protein [Pollutimonas bauzanensis]
MLASVDTGALASASSAATSAAGAAQESLQRARADARQNQPSIFSVQVLGFGNEPASDGSSAAAGNGSSVKAQAAGYRPNSAVQVVGDASMGEAARGQLTQAERQTLGL